MERASPSRALNFSVILLLFLVFLGPSIAEIRETSIEGDSRGVIELESFGFTENGALEFEVSNVSYRGVADTASLDLELIGLFLVTEQNWVQILMEYSNSEETVCILQNPLVKPIFYFKELQSQPSFGRSASAPTADQYRLMFGNCLKSVKVSMKVKTSMYNLQRNGKKDYLSGGETPLPKLYFIFFICYLTLVGVWIFVCWKKRGNLHMIHVLMGVLLLMKSLDLLCEAEDKSFIRRTGTAHGWDIAFYLFSFVKGVMLFTVITLIGTGWSFLKPFLQEREKKVLLVVIPLQVLVNVAAVIIGETGPARRDWDTWAQLLLLLDVICCCAVLFPIIWSIKQLRSAAQTDGKAARSLVKLTLFRQFYILVVSYIYLTRVVVYALSTIIVYKYSWVCQLATEIVTLAFYVITGYKFRPETHNPYFKLDEDEEAAAEEMLKTDHFDL